MPGLGRWGANHKFAVPDSGTSFTKEKNEQSKPQEIDEGGAGIHSRRGLGLQHVDPGFGR